MNLDLYLVNVNSSCSAYIPRSTVIIPHYLTCWWLIIKHIGKALYINKCSAKQDCFSFALIFIGMSYAFDILLIFI